MSKKQAITDWWAENPMTYGAVHGKPAYRGEGQLTEEEFGSSGFFENVDSQLFEWNRPLHTSTHLFGRIFPYARYQSRSVLEIGCGMGSMAMLWAKYGAHVDAVDLNPVAVAQTKKRFELYGLNATVQQVDARKLDFADNSFDFVYSWGVLHHSPEIKKSIEELFRVLKPNGEFGVMLYHRHSLLYLYQIRYLEGFLHGESKFLNSLELASRYSDGGRQEGNPHTWPITKSEARELFAPHTSKLSIKVLGTDLESSFKYLLPGISSYLPRIVEKAWARRWGWSLWISGAKR